MIIKLCIIALLKVSTIISITVAKVTMCRVDISLVPIGKHMFLMKAIRIIFVEKIG